MSKLTDQQSRKAEQNGNELKPDGPLLNSEQQSIRKWLKQVRFKKAVIGGVQESDVWKKIAELNSLYDAALAAERARYDALLEEHVQAAARPLAQQMYQKAMSAARVGRAGDERA